VQRLQPALAVLWQTILRHAASCAAVAHPASKGGRIGTQHQHCSHPLSMQRHMVCSCRFDDIGSLVSGALCCQALEPQGDWPNARRAGLVRRPAALVAVEAKALLDTPLVAVAMQALLVVAEMQRCGWTLGSTCHNLLRLLARSAQKLAPQASTCARVEENMRLGAQ